MGTIDGDMLAECAELLASVQADLALMMECRHDTTVLQRAHRCAHTVKGLVGFLGVGTLNDISAKLTDSLRRFRDSEAEVSPQHATELVENVARLRELLMQLAGSSSSSKPDAAPESGPTSSAASTEAAAGNAGTGAPPEPPEPRGWDALAATACARDVSFLAKALLDVLASLSIEASIEGNDYVRTMRQTRHDLSVLLDVTGDVVGTVVLSFDAAASGGIAAAVTTAMVGEDVEVPASEAEEFVRGALGELTNRTATAWQGLLRVSGGVSAPRFISARAAPVSEKGVAVRGFGVATPRGKFEVSFAPGVALAAESGGRAEAAAPEKTARRRVVLADDSIVMRKTLQRILTEAGYDVVAQARNGREAVEQVRRTRPDLTVMDINMPEMSGLDALRIIRADDPAARVLICSAVAETATISRGLGGGAVGYITKPFEPQNLVATVEELMRPASRSAAARAASATALDVATLGPYRVGRLLGEGGMANVYRGEDIGLGRQVALKVIKDEYANDADFVVRFLNEARAVAKVSHPNVVTVYYAGSDAGKHFFAMEYLAGPDLEALVEEGGRMEERQALTFGVQAACGLASAAAQGLVHCDVKPSNLMCYAGGLVKVTDFGISRAISATAAGADPLVMGTPWFMSPEQVVGGAVDFRSDIYALGATLYYLLVGVVPYEGDDMIEVALRQVHDPVPTPPGVSRKAARLVTRMMAKAPEARFSSYDELISEIRRLI